MHAVTTGESGRGMCSIGAGPGCTISFVPASAFEAGSGYGRVEEGIWYRAAAHARGGSVSVVVSNLRRPTITSIDRDDAWRRRLELSRVLNLLVGGLDGVSPAMVRHHAPLALLIPSYLEAFPPGATADDVWEAMFANTQRRFDDLVPALVAGRLLYDASEYARTGVDDAHYSHVAHFAWIYAQQVRMILDLVATYRDRQQSVVDIGTGCGHFLVTLARCLAVAGTTPRVRLVGIDTNDRVLARGKAALADSGVDVQSVTDDVCSARFADRLRRLRPDVIVANHILEHLPGDIKNRYLQDWLLAARLAVTVSVPLGDVPDSSISDHVSLFTPESVVELARSMELRVAYAAAAHNIDETRNGGLCTWMRAPETVVWGGFSCTTISLEPRRVEITRDPLVADFEKPFDPTEFRRVRRATKIGRLVDREAFGRVGHPRQVRQLLIKVPGGAVHLPSELAKFSEGVQLIIDHNKSANVDYDNAFAYLNVFQGNTGFSSYRGLSLNCHGDQLQSLRLAYAFKPDWSYIVSSTLPTMFFAQGFDLSHTLRRFSAGEAVNIYEDFNRQARHDCVYRSEDFVVYLLSPYIVHSAAAAEGDVERVFMKVALSTRRFFDNRELRRNPAFDIANWYEADTVGYLGGWLNHEHWNERFLKADVCPGWS